MLPDATFDRMPFLAGMKRKKSGGVWVTRDVHRQIARADTARGIGAWSAAAQAYGAALEQDPNLFHIWIQRGHAHKEAGELADAVASYDRARNLDPGNSEPHLHIGHVAKINGEFRNASLAYLTAARSRPYCAAAVVELGALLSKGVDIKMVDVIDFIESDLAPERSLPSVADNGLRHAGRGDPAKDAADTGEASGEHRVQIVYDVSDLVAYFANTRMPSGIQRVQIETITEALRNPSATIRICGFHEVRDEWVELPHDLFRNLCRLSADGHEEEWSACFMKMMITLSMGDAFTFPRGAFLVNLGTSWWIPNYFMFVRRAKLECGIRYVPFVHDMIPLVRSELCPPPLVRDFMAWVVSVLDLADFYLVNSQSTKRDLLKVSNYLNREIAPDMVEVVTLDALYRKDRDQPSRSSILGRHGLQKSSFVLLVSTIEPRKNHRLAFEAWTKLLLRYGARNVPKLVCVGNPGWMNEPIHDHLKARSDLAAKVVILSHLTDEDLTELYRSCLFTLYPSEYEGWGLPVTEALSHGKVPVCARSSSLPEAGGACADYFSLNSLAELVATLEKLMFDADYRRGRETFIGAEFKPRGWHQIADQISLCATKWSAAPATIGLAPPQAMLGKYHSLSRTLASRFWPGLRSTEGFRAGPNWWGRDQWGCWMKPVGGTLRFTVPDAREPHRASLLLLGTPNSPCEIRIDAAGLEGLVTGVLEPNERKWFAIEIPAAASADAPIEIDVVCATLEDLGATTKGGDTRVIAVGVCGFHVCQSDDTASRLALLEAAAMGGIDSLSVNHPPASFTSLVAYLEDLVGER